ncbi:PLD nuclease N-terminal domain-containing protein [Ectothiorhodospira lacustris]|uniref:PLD nuclease N-terminal domain-containing protein n=1 Tax=Ectothiorhodospira lacustris TaxID=2899127 RepID=UPI001EE91FAF|nr:PLD nuclease N-terminal domain-containing protein [Ectothiorhodospira lacustris]MCG5500092.1 PLD nuclease N-terminal domain-containing protein [Ectothiorhodospira lacustris]MCG5509446.1 PLD nuclease N-terminal domain-containing protein [Ectothiorhodospira lacustris]MCG5521500.1 PLD nuclease N-terminal domain-containing protein [Ectothiorhodospira lacustris]
MGFEVTGLLGLILLIAVIWAVVSTIQSRAGTGAKVLWIVLLLLLPVIGFILWLLLGPKAGR